MCEPRDSAVQAPVPNHNQPIDLSRAGSLAFLGVLDDRLDTMRLGSLDTLAAAALAAEEYEEASAAAGGNAGNAGGPDGAPCSPGDWRDGLGALPRLLTPLHADPDDVGPSPICTAVPASGCLNDVAGMGMYGLAGGSGGGPATTAVMPTVTPFAAIATATAAAAAVAAAAAATTPTPTPPPPTVPSLSISRNGQTLTAANDGFRTAPLSAPQHLTLGVGEVPPGLFDTPARGTRDGGAEEVLPGAVGAALGRRVEGAGSDANDGSGGGGGGGGGGSGSGSSNSPLFGLAVRQPLPTDLMAPGVHRSLPPPVTGPLPVWQLRRHGSGAAAGMDMPYVQQQQQQQQRLLPMQEPPQQLIQPQWSRSLDLGWQQFGGQKQAPDSICPSPYQPEHEKQPERLPSHLQTPNKAPPTLSLQQHLSIQPHLGSLEVPPGQLERVKTVRPKVRFGATRGEWLRSSTGEKHSTTPGAAAITALPQTVQPPVLTRQQQPQQQHMLQPAPPRQKASLPLGSAKSARKARTAQTMSMSALRRRSGGGGSSGGNGNDDASDGERSDGGTGRRRPRQAATQAAATIAAVARHLYGIREGKSSGDGKSGGGGGGGSGSGGGRGKAVNAVASDHGDDGGSKDADDDFPHVPSAAPPGTESAAAAAKPLPVPRDLGRTMWPRLPPGLPPGLSPSPPIRLEMRIPLNGNGAGAGVKRAAAAPSTPVNATETGQLRNHPGSRGMIIVRQPQSRKKLKLLNMTPASAAAAAATAKQQQKLQSSEGPLVSEPDCAVVSDQAALREYKEAAAEAEAVMEAVMAAAGDAVAAMDAEPAGCQFGDKTTQRRERNRLAARKCRAKKLEFIARMQAKLDAVASRNDALTLELLALRRMYDREVELKEAFKLLIHGCWHRSESGTGSLLPYTAVQVLSGLEDGSINVTELLATMTQHVAPSSPPLKPPLRPLPPTSPSRETATEAGGENPVGVNTRLAPPPPTLPPPLGAQLDREPPTRPLRGNWKDRCEELYSQDCMYGTDGETDGATNNADARSGRGKRRRCLVAPTAAAAAHPPPGFVQDASRGLQVPEDAGGVVGAAGTIPRPKEGFHDPGEWEKGGRRTPLPGADGGGRPYPADPGEAVQIQQRAQECRQPEPLLAALGVRLPAAATDAADDSPTDSGGLRDCGGSAAAAATTVTTTTTTGQGLAASGRMDSLDMLLAAMAAVVAMPSDRAATTSMSGGGVPGDDGDGDGTATVTATGSGDAAHCGGGSAPADGGGNREDRGGVLQPTHSISAFTLLQQACRQPPLTTPCIEAQLQMPGNMAAYSGLMEAAAAAVLAGGAVAGGTGGMTASMLPAADGSISVVAPGGGVATCSAQFLASVNAACLMPLGRMQPECFMPAAAVPPYSFSANSVASAAITGGLPLMPFLSWCGSGNEALCVPKHFQTAAVAAIDGTGGNTADAHPDAMSFSVSPSRQSMPSGTMERAQVPAAAPTLHAAYGGQGTLFPESYGSVAGAPVTTVSLPLPPKHPRTDLPQAHSLASPLASPGTSPRSQLPPPLPQQLAVPAAAACLFAPSAAGNAAAPAADCTAATGLAVPPLHHIPPIASEAAAAGRVGTYGGGLGLLQLAAGNEAAAMQHFLRPHNQSLPPRQQPPSQLQQQPSLPQEQQQQKQLRQLHPLTGDDDGTDFAGTSSGVSGGGNADSGGGGGGNRSRGNRLRKKARVALSHPIPLRGILPYRVRTAFQLEGNVGVGCVGRRVDD